MSNNYVRITSNDGQEVICKNFSQLFECLTAVNEKLLPDKFKVQICEDDWEFYDFPLNQQESEQKR